MIFIESLDLTNKVYLVEDVVGINIFLINGIPCTIPKVAPTQPKLFRRHIYLLRLWSKVIAINCSLSLMRRSTQDFITRPYNPNRQPLYIQSLACHANHFLLCTIYVGLPWVSEWLVDFLPIFRTKESIRRFRMGLYDWLDFLKKAVKDRSIKVRTIVVVLISAKE